MQGKCHPWQPVVTGCHPCHPWQPSLGLSGHKSILYWFSSERCGTGPEAQCFPALPLQSLWAASGRPCSSLCPAHTLRASASPSHRWTLLHWPCWRHYEAEPPRRLLSPQLHLVFCRQQCAGRPHINQADGMSSFRPNLMLFGQLNHSHGFSCYKPIPTKRNLLLRTLKHFSNYLLSRCWGRATLPMCPFPTSVKWPPQNNVAKGLVQWNSQTLCSMIQMFIRQQLYTQTWSAIMASGLTCDGLHYGRHIVLAGFPPCEDTSK